MKYILTVTILWLSFRFLSRRFMFLLFFHDAAIRKIIKACPPSVYAFGSKVKRGLDDLANEAQKEQAIYENKPKKPITIKLWESIKPIFLKVSGIFAVFILGAALISKLPKPVEAAALPPMSQPQPLPSLMKDVSSDCRCGSGRLCTGPRGGHYCITSGGHKRYR